MENQPLNTVYVSSLKFEELCADKAILEAVREALIGRLTIYEYKNRPEISFSENGFDRVVEVLFPAEYQRQARKLIADWKEKHPGYSDD